MFESLLIGTGIIFGILLLVLLTLLIWNKPVVVIYILFIYCSFFRILIAVGIPDFIKYFLDYLILMLLLQTILQFNKTKSLNVRKPLFFIMLFLGIAIISTLVNNSGIVFFIWGLRVNVRFYVFFLACTIFLTSKDLDKLMKYLFIMLPVNTLVVMIQFHIMGLRFDWVGGLYGIHLGCNDELILLLIIVCTITVVYYVVGKINFLTFIIYIGMICLVAAYAELKIVYLIVAFEVFMIFVLSFPNARAIKAAFFSASFMIFSFLLLLLLYPEWRELLGSMDKAIAAVAVDDYGHAGALSRFRAGPFILKNILIEPFQKLLGIGFGNADEFLIFTSSFYDRYQMTNYKIFRYATILVELGIIGIISYYLFFISIIQENIRVKRKLKNDYVHYYYISLIISLLTIPLTVYNPSMYIDGAFVVFFFLTFPFILEKENFEKGLISINYTEENNPGSVKI